MSENTNNLVSPPAPLSYFDRLSFKQAILAVVIALALGFAMSLVQGYISFKNKLSESQIASEQSVRSAKDAASFAAFSLDRELGKKIVLGLLEYDFVVLAEIYDETGNLLVSGDRKAHTIEHNWFSDLVFDDTVWEYAVDLLAKSQTNPIGRLKIAVHPDLIFGGFVDDWFRTLVLELFRNALLAIILAVAFYTLITRPIEKLTKYVNAYNSDQHRLPIDPMHRRDEIGELSESINRHFELQRKTESALSQSEHRFRDFAVSSSDWLWEMGADLRFSYMSDNIRNLGIEPTDIYGKSRQELFGGHTNTQQIRDHLQDLENHLPFRDFVFLRENGGDSETWIRTSGIPIFDETNTFVGYRGSASDISKQIAAEQQALSLVDAIDAIEIGFSLWDADDCFIRSNRTYRSWLSGVDDILRPGVRFEDVLRSLVDRGERPEAVGREEEWLQDRLKLRPKKNEPIVYDFQVSAGVWIESHEFRTIDNRIMTIGLNISERKQEEIWLLNSEEKLSLALEASKSGYWVRDLRSGDIFWSDENFRLLGYEPHSVQPSFDAWKGLIHPDDKDLAVSRFLSAVDNQSEFDFEFRIYLPSGAIRWLQNIGKSIVDANGNALVVTGIQLDITERKNLEEHLYQSHKMESIGQLTGGIAHDFNNILSVILGNLELVLDLAADNDELIGRAKIAHSGALRGAELTRKLLNFSRNEPLEQKIVSPNTSVNEVRELIEKSFTAPYEVHFELQDGLWLTRADPGDFEDALLNITLNARDAMPKGGRLVVSTSNVTVRDEDEGVFSSMVPGDYVKVTVSDTGIGMTPEVKAKVFDPFFTTKGRGKGTGLGMSMVYSFTERTGGHVGIQSVPKKGTAVSLFLPRAEGEVDLIDGIEQGQEGVPTGNEAILIVDDEDQVCEFANIVLTSLGYTTFTAHSGEQALTLLEETPEIDLLFSDVVMSGKIDGYDLASKSLELNPLIKIILTTGYDAKQEANRIGKNQLFAELAGNMLRKPYRKLDLAKHVRRALDSAI